MKIALYNDVAFKWSFGRQEHTAPLVSLLNSVIGYGNTKFVFKDIQIINPFDISTFPKEKQGILDIRVKDNRTRKWADVEIQVRYQAIYPERSMYYLAGMYRDQLRTGNNFENLRPCYGVHILVSDLFRNEPDWYNHFRMLNVRTFRPLSTHWEMYFIELEKFGKALKNGKVEHCALTQWCEFLSKPQDPSVPLCQEFENNSGIREVYEMLPQFIKNDKLREQYRLHEEWVREQKYYDNLMKKQDEKLLKEKRKRKEAEQKKIQAEQKKVEAEQKKVEAEQKKVEAEQKKVEAEREKELLKKRSVLALKESGLSNKKIAELLGISENEILKTV